MKLRFLAAILPIWILTFSVCFAAGNSTPEMLYSEASKLMLDMEETKTSSKVFMLYRIAKQTIQRISSDFPSSTVAAGLLSGEIKISGLTLAQFQELELPLKLMSEAEKDPLAFVLATIITAKQIDPSNFSGTDLLVDILVKYAASGHLGQALEIANTIRNSEKKASLLIQIAAGYTRAGQEHKAVKLLSQALEMAKTIGYKNDAALILADIAVEYALAGKKEEANRILSESLDMSKTIEYGTTVELILEIENKFKVAEQNEIAAQILTLAFNEATSIKGRKDEGYTMVKVLTDIAARYRWARQQEKADVAIALALKTAEAERDVSSRTKLLSLVAPVYFDFGNRGKAYQLVEQIRKTVKATDSPYSVALILAESAYTYGYDGYQTLAFRLLNPALDAANKIRYAQDKASALIEVAAAYAVVSRKESAVQILSQALETAKKIKDERKNKVFELLASRFGKYGHLDKSLEIAQMIVIPSRKADALAGVATLYAKAGEFFRALDTANIIEKKSVKAETLSNIAIQYAKAGDEVMSIQIFAHALQTSLTIKDSVTKSSAIGRCVDGYAEAGLMIKALETASSIENANEKSKALVSIAKSFDEVSKQPGKEDFQVLRSIVYRVYSINQ